MAFKMIEDEAPDSGLDANLLHRVPAQIGTRIATEVAGLPGNILSPINEYIAAPITKAITKKEPLSYKETTLGKIFPTSQTLQEGISIENEYLRPRNKGEQLSTDVVGDATSLFLPGKAFKAGKYALTPLKSLGASVASNALGEGVYEFTGDKNVGNNVKNGALLAFSLFNKPKADKIVGLQYNKAASLLPANATQDARSLTKGLNNLKSSILKGRKPVDLAPSETFVIDEADKILRQIKSGEVSIDTLVSSKRSLNEMLNKFVFGSADKGANSRARKLATQINGEIKNVFNEYGKKNPEWLKTYSGADQAFGAISQSNYISRALENVMKGRVNSNLGHLFGIGAEVGLGLAGGVPTAITTFGAYQGAKILHRVMKSPVLRRHYGEIIKAAATENVKALNSRVDKFEDELQKSKEKEKGSYRLLD